MTVRDGRAPRAGPFAVLLLARVEIRISKSLNIKKKEHVKEKYVK